MNPFNIYSETEKWAHDQASHLQIFAKPQIDSTNTWAKKEFNNHKSRAALYLTSDQTAGRGRGSNKWTTPGSGSYLLSTWAFPVAHVPQPPFPLRVGVALYSALKMTWPKADWSLKAPNDLLLNGKKIAGLLIEIESQSASIASHIGLGLNVWDFPKNIENACALNQIQDLQSKDWHRFLKSWFAQLQTIHTESLQSPLGESEKKSALEALNRNPLQKEMLTGITDSGDLLCGTKKISWRDL